MPAPPARTSPRFAYVGSFTTPGKRKGRGAGISVFRIAAEDGAWHHVQSLDVLPNPHWLALDAAQRCLYSAHGDSSEIGAYARDPQDGRLRFLGRQETGGDNASTVVTSPDGRHVVLANGPGVAVFPVKADGSLGPRCTLVIPPGAPGPWRVEQFGPHPHQALFDPSGRFVLVPDKGLDHIHVYRFDAATGALQPHDPPGVRARYGAVPRHLVFHPAQPFAYVVNEMDSTVYAYHWDAARGTLEAFQRITTLPTTCTCDNTAAEIALAPSGGHLYVSNRGHHSIAAFGIDEASGMLEHRGWEPVQGQNPRFFCLDAPGTRLFVANEDSHTIVVFALDAHSGMPVPTGQVIATGSPASITFAY